MKEKFIISIVTQTGRWIFTFIGSYLFILYLDVGLMGIWALLNSIVNLGFLFINLGFDSIHYQYSGKENFEEYFGSFFLIKLFLLISNIFISILIISLFELWNSEYILIVLFIIFSKIITDALHIFVVQLKAKIKIFKVEVPLFIITIGQNVSKVYIALNLLYIPDPLFILCLTNFFFNVIYIFLISLLSKGDVKIWKLKKEYVIAYLKDTKPLIIYSIFNVIYINIGNILLDFSFAHEDLAYFNLVNTYIIPLLGLISTTILTICLPLFSQYFEKDNKKEIQNIVSKIEKYTSILLLSSIIIVFIAGDLIFSLLLPNYLNALPILYIMVFIPYLSGITRPFSVLLISGKKQKLSASWSIFNCILRLTLIFILIPKELLIFQMLGLGSIGYALALLAPNIISAFVMRYFIKKYFDIKSQKRILIYFIIAVFSLFITFLLKDNIFSILIQNQIILIIILTLIVLGIFLGILSIFHELKKEDIIFFLDLLNIRRYVKSVKTEFLND